MNASKIKTTLICFFNAYRIIHEKFVPQGQMINQKLDKEVLEQLRKRIDCVRPEIADCLLMYR